MFKVCFSMWFTILVNKYILCNMTFKCKDATHVSHVSIDDFDFDIVNFSFLDTDIPRRPPYGVYISQLIRFSRECSHVDDFNTHNNA